MLIETLLGAATGILGNAVGGIFKWLNGKQELKKVELQNAHDVAMVQAETQAMIMESKANIAITKAKVEGEIEVADANVYLQSQKEGNKTSFDNKWIEILFSVTGKWRFVTIPAGVIVAAAFGFVDFLRGIIRPTLTTYLVGLTTYITYLAWQIMQTHGISLSADQAVEIYTNVTSIVIYLTVSCVTWWYGDRRISKTIMDMQKKKAEPNENVSF